MAKSRRGLAPWQTRWVALHDDLHLLEVLMDAIIPSGEHTPEYWDLSTRVIAYAENLREAYERELARGGNTADDPAYVALRRRLAAMQAQAQQLTLENEVSAD